MEEVVLLVLGCVGFFVVLGILLSELGHRQRQLRDNDRDRPHVVVGTARALSRDERVRRGRACTNRFGDGDDEIDFQVEVVKAYKSASSEHDRRHSLCL